MFGGDVWFVVGISVGTVVFTGGIVVFAGGIVLFGVVLLGLVLFGLVTFVAGAFGKVLLIFFSNSVRFLLTTGAVLFGVGLLI